MPLYEYKCDQCGHKFEELVGSSVTDNSLTCPACGANTCRRQFSTFSSNLRRGSFSTCSSGSCSTCAPSSRFR
jgi:putative FmdB family regulatory protein